MGHFLYDFGPFLGRSGVTLGSIRDHFGIVLVSFSTPFEAFWALFGLFLEHFWAIFDPIFGPFSRSFFFAVFFLLGFAKLTTKLSKLMQEKAKLCKFPPNSPNICKILQKQVLFRI